MGEEDNEQKDKYFIKNCAKCLAGKHERGSDKKMWGSPLAAVSFSPYLPAQLFPGDGVQFIYLQLMAQ